jgi:cytochrome c5
VTYNARMAIRRAARPLIVAAAALAAAIVWSPIAPRAAGQDDELPDAPAKKVLLRACTTCHDLDEVTKFKGYYTRAQWKDIVVTMREYGATLADGEVDLLSDYLAGVLGKKE